MAAVDDLEILRLCTVVRFLQGVVYEAVADHCHAVVVGVEPVGLRVVEQVLPNLLVDPVGVTEMASDVALRELIAVLVEDPGDFVHGQAAYQNAHVTQRCS